MNKEKLDKAKESLKKNAPLIVGSVFMTGFAMLAAYYRSEMNKALYTRTLWPQIDVPVRILQQVKEDGMVMKFKITKDDDGVETQHFTTLDSFFNPLPPAES